MYSRSMRTGESKAVPCPDPRCALSFDSIQDLQCHCQDVHCIERIKLDPIKRRRRTPQSLLNVKALPGVGVKLTYRYDLVREESPFENVNESMNSPTLEPIDVDVIVATGPVTLNKRNSATRRCSLPSTDMIISQDRQSPSTATFTHLKTSLSMTDWTSDETAHNKLTSTSSVSSGLSLSIDPRLLDESHQLVPVPQPKS